MTQTNLRSFKIQQQALPADRDGSFRQWGTPEFVRLDRSLCYVLTTAACLLHASKMSTSSLGNIEYSGPQSMFDIGGRYLLKGLDRAACSSPFPIFV